MADTRMLPAEIINVLIGIWQAVLEVPNVSLRDDFLDLGGDSLSAMMCVSRIKRRFGCAFEVEEFFMDGANVEHFAKIIASRINDSDPPA